MEFWQALILALIGASAAVATAWLGFRDLGMRRRLEASSQFLKLFAVAHGRPTDGRDSVGIGEQVATVHLIADYAVKEDLVRNAAKAGLTELSKWDELDTTTIQEVLPALIKKLPNTEVAEATAKVVATFNRRGKEAIAQAARDALKRLD